MGKRIGAVIFFVLCIHNVYAFDPIVSFDEQSLTVLNEELRKANSIKKTDDIEFVDTNDGIILTDRTTGTRYRIYVSGGALSVETV